jgi:hypothetical protein
VPPDNKAGDIKVDNSIKEDNNSTTITKVEAATETKEGETIGEVVASEIGMPDTAMVAEGLGYQEMYWKLVHRNSETT